MMDKHNSANKGAVVITGTSSGIGRAAALHLDRMGFKVFAGVRKKEDGESLRRESTDSLTPLIIDITNNDSISKASEIVAESVREAGLNGLVNNAGIPCGGPVEFVSVDDIWKMMHVNMIGHIVVIQTFLPLLRRAGGRIINIGSIGGILPLAFNGPYSASKAALKTITDALRLELRPSGIQVSMVIPGNVRTAIWEKAGGGRTERAEHFPPELFEYYGQILAKFMPFVEKMRITGMAPERVAQVIYKVLTSKRPGSCYLVGSDAKLQALMARFLPDGIRDRIMLRYMGILS